VTNVVFVGLGFGGLYSLRHFMDDAPPGIEVTAIDRRDRFVFTPLLYEYLADELEVDVVAPKLSELVPEGVRLRQAEVVEISVEECRIRLDDGSALTFDTLVLAPGSVPVYHGVPGAERNSFPFYSLDDADRLKTALRLRDWAAGGLPVAVVGGGVVGIELAFALTELVGSNGGAVKPPVVVLEAATDILAGVDDSVRAMARRKLDELGIELRTGVRVEEVEESAITFQADGRRERLETVAVAWTAGIQPNPILDMLPAERQGKHGVTVAPTLQLPAANHVFVVGDAIAYPGRADGEPPLPDTAQAALQEAPVCATNVRRLIGNRKQLREFQYDGMGEFLRVGHGKAIANIRGAVVDGAAAALARRAAYLLRMPAWAVRSAAVRQWLT